MNKPKAPKDMTVDEFIDLVEKRYHTEDPTNMNSWINTLRMIAEEPAPNPFTPDQIAWMRAMQRSGWKYATRDENCVVCVSEQQPTKWQHGWTASGGYESIPDNFLDSVVIWDDPEPLCFADYAPLEGATK